MRDKPLQGPAPPQGKIPAGYTYFGQFIDHDLTDEDFAPEGVQTEPTATRNRRRTFLNLETLYGDGPGSTTAGGLYDGVSFRLGEATFREKIFDVPLNGVSKKPEVADDRNLENAILRQIHAMFLKLHNVAAKTLPFEDARLRVRHQYQWLVRNDFLFRVCDRTTLLSVLKEPLVDWNGRFSIPVEFAQAAFRFGHSMVREEYLLGEKAKPVCLRKLFGGKDSTGALSSKYGVDWSKFLSKRATQFAMAINTNIVAPLFEIPGPTHRLFTAFAKTHQPIVLPYTTMKRGVASRLPSGQAVRAVLGAPGIPPTQGGIDLWSDLIKCGLQEHTPLWYYILLEAQSTKGNGLRLGPVGSLLVAEVIEGALWANPDSYLRQHGRDWKPDCWPTRHGDIEIRSLYDVAIVADLAEPIK
jgi:hypothetical protein